MLNVEIVNIKIKREQMYNSAKQGWYKVLNVKKFIMQTNESKSVMNSVRIVELFI